MNKEQIINEIKLYLGYKKDIELADFLGVKQNTLSTWKSRNTLDYELLISKCDFLNANWLITGQGSMLKEPTQPTSVQEMQPSNNDDELITLLKENNATLKAQLKDKEEKEALLKDKIADLERRLAFAEVKDKEEMSLKIKTQRKKNKEKDEIILAQTNTINLQNEEINDLKSRHLPPDEPLQPSKGL